jgi:hypothetical protein
MWVFVGALWVGYLLSFVDQPYRQVGMDFDFHSTAPLQHEDFGTLRMGLAYLSAQGLAAVM